MYKSKYSNTQIFVQRAVWDGQRRIWNFPRTTWIWELQAADIAYAPVQDQLPRLREWQGSSYLKGWSRFWLDCTEWFMDVNTMFTHINS